MIDDIIEFLIAQKFRLIEDQDIYYRPNTIIRFILKDNATYRIICDAVAINNLFLYVFIGGIQVHAAPLPDIQYIEILDCDEKKFADELQKVRMEVNW